MNILAQFVGTAALISLALSYQNKTKSKFLKFQVLANIFYAIQYCMLFAFSAAVSSTISLVKTLIFLRYESKSKNIPKVTLLIFILIYGISGVLSYNGTISLIPIIIAIVYTVGSWQSNLKITYFIGLIVGILWVIYNYNVGAYVAIIGGIVEFLSGTIGLIRVIKGDNRNATKQ